MVAEVYQDVFIDFCKINITQIIEDEDQGVLSELLKLMGVGMKKLE